MNKRIQLFDWWKVLSLTLILSCSGINLLAQDLVPGAWPHLKGYWKFQNINKLTKATVGKDFVLTGTHQAVIGPSVGDTAIRIGIGSYYTCSHGMAPNGGGDSVNRYTLMFDFKVLSFKKWHTFFKTDSNNNNDGECFIRPLSGSDPGRIGVAATGYSKDSINPNQWYRLMISVNLNNFYRYYLNGKLLLEGDTQEVDGRFALTPKMIFFGDDNQEDDTIDVASVAVFDTCLSAKDIATIGSIDPCVANAPKISLGRDTSLCDYNSIVKNAGAGFKKYQWSTGASSASVTLTKNIGIGKKNVWCKVTDMNGCITADTFILTYLASPTVNLGSDQAFCQGYTSKLIAGTDTSFQYLWRFLPKGNTLSVKNNLSTDSGGNYTVTVTSKPGCASKDTIQITVFKRPAKPVISITGKTALCQGESVMLSGPGGYFDYLWSNGANQQSITSSKNDTLKLKVVDVNNCVSFYSDSVVVKVFALPPKPKLKLTGNMTFCFGDTVYLEAPPGYVKYSWEDGSGQVKRDIMTPGKFYVNVTNASNCQSENSDTIILNVNPRPSKPAVTITGKTSICEGESLILTAPAGFSYLWSDSNTSRSITVNTSGKYAVRIEDGYGCWSIPSDSVFIVVHLLPNKPSVVKAGKDSLKSNITGVKYNWYRNGALLTDTNGTISSAPSGHYQVQIRNNWCWSLLSDSFFYANSGFGKLGKEFGALMIYPNPSNGAFTVRLKNPLKSGNAFISIIDMQGREVYRLSIMNPIQGVTFAIDLRHLAPGSYLINITDASGVYTGRVEKTD